MTRGRARGRRADAQAGYALVALVAATTIMLIVMAAAVPAWRYVMKNEREEELLFRGKQIADAIQRFQGRLGRQPLSLEEMVKQKYLRKEYKDPMAADGKWKLLRDGDLVLPPGATRRGPDTRGGSSSPPATLIPGQSTTGPGGKANATVGPFRGVASVSTEKSLRLFVSQSGIGESYDQWRFVAGQPFYIGRPPKFSPGRGTVPGLTPAPSPR